MDKIKLRIHTWPEKILRKNCKQIEKVDDKIRKILYDMLVFMRLGDGAGLAANQVGFDLRLIVVEVGNQIFKLVNPQIVRCEGIMSFQEGCLSFPGLVLEIERSNKVWVTALDERGESVNIEAEGILAIVLQHEIDHIDGKVFIDKASIWQRLAAFGKMQTIKRRTKNGLSKQAKKH